MVSKRIKYARAHLSRRRHIAILATPLWRRTQRIDSNCLPRPFSVSRAALRARPTKRIKMMAQPKGTKSRRFDRTASQSRVSLQYPQMRESGAEPNKRLFDLSLPKKSALLYARRLAAGQGNANMVANINVLLKELRKSRYQKYRIICNSLQQRAAARERREMIRRKLHKALEKAVDWGRLAAPKRIPKPPRPLAKIQPRGGKRKEKDKKKPPFDPVRMESLAQPRLRPSGGKRDPFRVAKSALVGPVSDYILTLASRENPRPEVEYREPGKVSPDALRVVASTRTMELAKPSVRPRGLETDLKEDAFSVPPLALKARCSPRVKVLAQPKKRKRNVKT